ncbi:MAG TPA: hypothetical protein VNQ90_14900 [Chthoniobacteraceae bacterium]|nr:hypothetical protein [Chthoniobacteraceae bacterium]
MSRLLITTAVLLSSLTAGFAAITLDTAKSRTAFLRMEKNARLQITIRNDEKEPLEGAVLELAMEGGAIRSRQAVPSLEAGEERTLDLVAGDNQTKLTDLKPGRYAAKVNLADGDGTPVGEPASMELTVVPRPLPHRMPVIMWGNASLNDDGPLGVRNLKKIGFTHWFALWQGSTDPAVEFVSPARIDTTRKVFDTAFAMQLGGLAQLSIGKNEALRTKYNRIDRTGNPRPTLNGQFPEAREAAENLGKFVGRTFGDLPGLSGALIDTEVRDHSRPSFHPVDREAYRREAHADIPPEVGDSARGVDYRRLSGFPDDRIVPDDHPILAYYRWFWKEGDGWNRLHTLVDRGFKSQGHDGLWTWFDPAARGASVYGGGGSVDFLSHWTYSYPDPLKISLATDQTAAMAEGRPGQGIMVMSQAIWYRSQTAPEQKAGKNGQPRGDRLEERWEEVEPDARFITIAPDHLSESLWLMLSHPVKGIMYHGWGSLVESKSGYRHTHPGAQRRLKEMIASVVEPLGPTLMQLPDARNDVAFLESFASQVFAGRGTFGSGNGWGADAYLITRYAGLQPRIVYDETILKQGLDGFSVLVMPHCDVLTESVSKAITLFQKKGGIVIGDEFLSPAIQPDLLLTSFRRERDAKKDKEKLFALAAWLRAELEGYYSFAVTTDQPEIILRRRSYGASDYLFAINDRRDFGNYVGQYGLVMEEGKPTAGKVTIAKENGVVYDLMRHQTVAPEPVEGGVRFPVGLAGGGGGLFLIMNEAAGKLEVAMDKELHKGSKGRLKVRLPTLSGKRLEAIAPMKVIIRDPEGREAEGSGYYGAKDGLLDVPVSIAANDLSGRWEVEVTEGVSGQRAGVDFEVR